MVQGRSGKDIIETFAKTGILVKNVPMFLRHSRNLVFEYVTNRSEEVVSLQKDVYVSQSNGQHPDVWYRRYVLDDVGSDRGTMEKLLSNSDVSDNTSEIW